MLLELQKGGENGEEEDHSWGDQQYLGKVAETYINVTMALALAMATALAMAMATTMAMNYENCTYGAR